MKAHLTKFRVTYITTSVAIASSIGAELAALKDTPPAELGAKSWVFWTCLLAAIVVSAGNNVVAALHQPPEEDNATPSVPEKPVTPTQ